MYNRLISLRPVAFSTGQTPTVLTHQPTHTPVWRCHAILTFFFFFWPPCDRFLFTITSVKSGPRWPLRVAPSSVSVGLAASRAALLFSDVQVHDGRAVLLHSPGPHLLALALPCSRLPKRSGLIVFDTCTHVIQTITFLEQFVVNCLSVSLIPL